MNQILSKIQQHLAVIYDGESASADLDNLSKQILQEMKITDSEELAPSHINLWDEKDVMLITYGDSIEEPNIAPLASLHDFLNAHCKEAFNSVHILPFFPYSSDDGFSVIDYSSVNESLGNWQDIKRITENFRMMADVVINHCSARSQWFQNFINGQGTGQDFFYTADKDIDVTGITRPRTSPLLKEVETANGTQYVWCTFSHDQVDFDFTNPKVLLTFISIIRQYLDQGIRIFRLDAVAFLWKQLGTSCINLPQTHEVIRLLRTLVEIAQPDAVLITETNIPNRQNLTYFGNANEAHAIYNFSLPPLLINSLITGDCTYLKSWMMSMPPAQNGTTYFNFIASHDGIGLRPAEGLLSELELNTLLNTMQGFGGRVSWRTSETGEQKAYELNIALIDAMQGTVKGPDKYGIDRFMCAHGIMFALEGIPGVYIHSLLGTSNDYEKMENTGHNRSINRHRWNYDELKSQLGNSYSQHSKVLARMQTLLTLRREQPAFHPNATQFTLQLGDDIFGFWRQSMDRQQSIFCINNVTDETKKVSLSAINLISTDHWKDIISGHNIDFEQAFITLQPYQCMWISNV